MAGTLVVSTLSDGTNSTSATNAIRGSAKAWVNFNGGTSPGTIRAQYNVSSVTKNGTGDYTLNLTNALVDTSAVVAGSWTYSSPVPSARYALSALVPSTSQVRVTVRDSNAALVDADPIMVAVFR